ncbi:MAG: DUF4321 domain-containing protein [Bacillota bacterium]
MRRGFSTLVFVLLVAFTAVLGNLLGEALSGVIPFLGRMVVLGLHPPFTADLGFLRFSLGFSLSFNLVGLVGLLLGVFLYRRWS